MGAFVYYYFGHCSRYTPAIAGSRNPAGGWRAGHILPTLSSFLFLYTVGMSLVRYPLVSASEYPGAIVKGVHGQSISSNPAARCV